MDYPEHVLQILRQRVLDFDENDKSQDAALNRMFPRQVLLEICAWKLGDPDWFDTFEGWLEDVGLEITRKETT